MKRRAQIAYIHDLVMTALSFAIALYLRLGDRIYLHVDEYLWIGAALMTAIGAVVYWFSGLYRGIWRYASIRDLTAIARAASLTVLIFVVVMFLWTRLEFLPRSIPIINWFVLMALLGGPRLAYRLYRDRQLGISGSDSPQKSVPVLLVGAGDGAEFFIRGLSRSATRPYRVVGIISERPDRVGQQIHGVRIVGSTDDVERVLANLSRSNNTPHRLILTKEGFDGAVVRRIFDVASAHGMTVARIPKITDLRSGSADRIETRPIDVADLLGRPQTPLDRAAMKQLIAGNRILVTGAGGSIGSELIRQIADLEPTAVCLVDSSEYNLYEIDQELGTAAPQIDRRAVLADVRDAMRVDACFEAFRPEIVFHAAALKHVPLVEANTCEGVLTNVFGTVNVADACRAHGVRVMVQISTDKAVNPTSIMGMTKRVAEQYCQALDIDDVHGNATQIVTVRFGNVLGSTGSVIPLFQRQLASGGPLTVTHPEMTRYFMTVREAVELVLMASATAASLDIENGRIFVLDMGEPVRIMDLAEQMIRLAGYEPGKDVKIEISGLRPGEKLFEEIFHGEETLVPAGVPGLLLAAPRSTAIDRLRTDLEKLRDTCVANDPVGARKLLVEIVPESRAADENGSDDHQRVRQAAGNS
ncbi:MAG: nucleoside-diphosphate sugar epimerase/dehydratase [Rhodospirillales bacterium]